MKKILFICVENACRSQVAEAFFNKYSKDARAYSAGSKPAKEIDPKTVEVMKEKGIDLHGKKPSGFQPLQSKAFDIIITMGCKDSCPITPKEKTIDWRIENPKGRPIEKYREIRDEIERKVSQLIENLG
ncbi:TPA: arsenate reductase ArsC [Candidatus Micrarchaeota archaeon]|nr:arsenate reductase ArsC [Candidatus Micrarchaeota archaeon]HIH30957.1 arsenate reductase ArsC [Candidatus Micrarchaeota archaeon]